MSSGGWRKDRRWRPTCNYGVVFLTGDLDATPCPEKASNFFFETVEEDVGYVQKLYYRCHSHGPDMRYRRPKWVSRADALLWEVMKS